MVESTAASVVLMVCTQANPSPHSLYHSIRDSREKVSVNNNRTGGGR
ncbi:rCG35536 [Rattus norvegicus]|uniref:RCG35536 n=1 Tax=Rattus norvegicus TaxID=10116 RepID=A6HD76_RAT|nr:rCG35536 [Rattus norvegicus]